MKHTVSIAVILAVLISLSSACFAQGEQATISPRYAYINSCSYSLSISSAGVATCTAACNASSTAYKVRVNCYYQYYNSNKWSSFKFWSDTDFLQASVNEQANTISGITNYRLKAVFTIYDSAGNQLETATYYDYATYIPSN